MAMSINLTLVVQIFHFLVAYVLISKFLLKPGYEALKEDEDRLRQLRAVLIQEQERLAQKQEYKRSRWQVCQNYFYLNRPVFEIEAVGLKFMKPIEVPQVLSPEEKEKLAHEVSAKIKEKVLS